MAKTLSTIQEIQNELDSLSENKSLAQAQRVILSVIRLLDDSVSVDNKKMFELFNVDNQKISANANWFYEDSVMVDRRATYKIHAQNSLNIDFKLYGLTKPSKRTISWIQALIPNFEDEPFNSKYSIGIDFVVPKSADKVIIVLSNSYVIRTLELKGTLTATFQEILSKWANISDFSNKKEVHAILWESFDLQPLNKKFYAGISERFITLRQHLTKTDVLDDKHASLFANRLLGRVIFCWFLDKKGIINADKKYFDSESFESDNEYYKTKLENLFFGVLNTPIPDREYRDEVTPFLNGGLFEARDTDLYKSSKLTFPKNYFDDLFGFLSAYNFTTDESTSQFQQVAIDPEMLGRIFENLLAEMTEEDGGQARKAKGAFYTPREIVDYMCRESLKEYLKTKLPEDEHRDQRLEQLIDRPDKEFQDQDHNWRRDWKPYKDSIIDALDELKVLDPACGSGAFPIGMLQLLVKVYERLEARFDPYKTKLQIIEKNIYGVDIEPMAVEIARLRTWLSIIVDEEADSKKIKPLPNLEFKFVCANSLITLDQSGQDTLLEMEPDLEKKLRDIRDAYFNTESLAKKKKLKSDYEKLVNVGEGLFGASEKSKQLKTYRPFDNETSASFFDSEFMFGVSKFDVVIGNPPYVQIQKFKGKEIQKMLEKQGYESFSKTGDLYILFYERGIKITKNQTGLLCYITSNKWLRSQYGEKLRDIFSKLNPIILIDLGSNVFESATVDSNVLLIRNEKNSNNTIAVTASKNNQDLNTLANNSAHISFDSSDPWMIINPDQLSIKHKLHLKGTPLSEWNVTINKGLMTGCNSAFYIDKNTKDELIRADKKSEELIYRNFRGREILKYYTPLTDDSYVIVSSNYISIDDYPAVKNHLLKYEVDLKNRAQYKRGDHEWFTVDNCPSKENLEKYRGIKIIYPNITQTPSFSIDKSGTFSNDKTFTIVADESEVKYLCGVLNSKLLNVYFKMSLPKLGDNGYEVRKIFFIKTPVPKITKENINTAEKIGEIVDTIVELKKNNEDTKDLEGQIDELVMDLYDLTDEEKKIIYDTESK